MTRRLSLAILIIVWITLIAMGVSAYAIVRSILIADLDHVLFARAAALPELVRPAEDSSKIPQYDWNDVYTVEDVAGRAVSTSKSVEMRPIEPPKLVNTGFTEYADGRRMRTVTVSAVGRLNDDGQGPPMRVRVTYSGSVDHVDAVMGQLARWLALCVLAGGVIAAACSYWLSRVALRPLLATAERVGEVNEQRLHTRLIVEGLPEELRPIATRLNDMLARLEYAFSQRKQFVADASHELRTPVAALTTMLEIALRQPREADAYRQTIESCLTDARLLRRLVERLMEHVRGEGIGGANADAAMASEPTDVLQLLHECADISEVIASDREIRIVRSLPDRLVCELPAERLRSIVLNLLGNAVEHNPNGATVELTSFHDGQRLHVAVRDDGKGIASEHVPHLFEPFYRADAAHRADSRHLGLGLFLVQSHLHAMGATCRVESQVGVGSTFHIEVPCVAINQPRTAIPNPQPAAIAG